MAWLFATGIAGGQTRRSTADDVADAIRQARSGHDLETWQMEEIAQIKAVQAVPFLKSQFLRASDQEEKLKAASVLVRLGVSDPMYWDFLMAAATPAVMNDAPSYLMYNSQGRVTSEDTSGAFAAWAKAHDLSLSTAVELVTEGYPITLGLMAQTGDARALPLYLKGLRSPNALIQAESAQGLVELHDPKLIHFIVEACERAPRDAQGAIALPLLYWDDPRARSAAARFLPPEMLTYDPRANSPEANTEPARRDVK